jgi:hypothetical protein
MTEPKMVGVTPRMELAVQVSDRVQIQDVRLVRCNCQMQPAALALPAPMRFRWSFAHNASTQAKPDGTHIAVLARFRFSANREGSTGDQPSIAIEATFLLTYAASSMNGLGEEHLRSFGTFNGVFNAWPYWRELLQSITSRMGLPGLVVPVFRLGSAGPQASAMTAPTSELESGQGERPAT